MTTRQRGRSDGRLPRMPPLKTIYCGKKHRLSDGVPVGHACRILDPAYLRAERDQEYGTAARLLQGMRLELHGGVRE